MEKNLRIINELVIFCHMVGAQESDIHFAHTDGSSVIEVTSPVEDLDEHTIAELWESLNLPRQREIEQDYWELSGDSETVGELPLVGMMLDEATVEYRQGVLLIRALRKD